MNITGTFIFHNVGQGLFYSGRLHTPDNNTFNFVYDCGCTGSKPSLVNAIKNYRRMADINSSKKIHLLVLSHLHEDHVNGLKELLKNGVQVDTMVIPYFSEESKQLARIGSNKRDEFLQKFYDDPFDLPVRRIFIIGAPEKGAPENESITEDQEFTIDADEPSEKRRFYTKNRITIRYRQFWKFCFENMPFPQSDIDLYVKDLLAKGNGKTLDELIQDRKFVRNLRREICETFSGVNYRSLINRTSVMMLHSPIESSICQEQCSILTGDVELHCGDSSNIVNRNNHDVLVLQIPHHGGYCGCIHSFLNLQAKYNVISYGLKNRYGHPNPYIISALSGMLTVHVNEKNPFCYPIIS